MKKFISGLFWLCCLVLIGLAGYTVYGCITHINDDHSQEALLADRLSMPTFQSTEGIQAYIPTSGVEPVFDEDAENPSVAISIERAVTANNPNISAVAAFSEIINNIHADLIWKLDGETVLEQPDCLLTDGSIQSCEIPVDVTDDSPEEGMVTLEVLFGEKQLEAETPYHIEKMISDNSIMVKTVQVETVAKKTLRVYETELLEQYVATMKAGTKGVMLDYYSDGNEKNLLIRFSDGTTGWVNAKNIEISDVDYTADEDYTQEIKEEFVNSMDYNSGTKHLVWVSLYTQTVNVFTGYMNHWRLIESFECATGVNQTPTTVGTFRVSEVEEQWDLGKTYVKPVIVFNGGEAFTSQPYDIDTDEIADKTIGKPASGGSVRLKEADIAWLRETIALATTVVVY